jgi:hypothetical protein
MCSASRWTSDNAQAMAEVVICQSGSNGGLLSISGQSVVDLCWLNGTGISSSPSTFIFTCQYNFTNDPYSFIHLLPIPYNLSN